VSVNEDSFIGPPLYCFSHQLGNLLHVPPLSRSRIAVPEGSATATAAPECWRSIAVPLLHPPSSNGSETSSNCSPYILMRLDTA